MRPNRTGQVQVKLKWCSLFPGWSCSSCTTLRKEHGTFSKLPRPYCVWPTARNASLRTPTHTDTQTQTSLLLMCHFRFRFPIPGLGLDSLFWRKNEKTLALRNECVRDRPHSKWIYGMSHASVPNTGPLVSSNRGWASVFLVLFMNSVVITPGLARSTNSSRMKTAG